jgi:DNA-binding NarL/FixJ family response regulator
MKNFKLIITDDSLEFRQAIKQYLTGELKYEVIGEASDGLEFLALPNLHKADVILMDLMMPNLDGFKATKELFWSNPNVKVIAVTMHVDKAYLAKLIQVGFKGCVFKNNFFEEIETAILKVADNKLHFPININI